MLIAGKFWMLIDSHVLSPKTDWPVNYIAAISVIDEFCVVAASASTIGMQKGEVGPQ